MNFFSPGALLEAMTPRRLFARLSIARKMLLGYMLLVVLTVAVVVYALAGLQRLHGLNNGVIRVDVPVQEAADAMLDAILAQDTYEKRYLVLVRTDVRGLFWKRGKEFDVKLALLKSLPGKERSLEEIEKLHRGQRLGKLEEMYLDASPLTRLPGGLAIENVLKRRLESEHPFAFCVLDLDNFKAFNDHYGYANGNDVIKETARIIEDAAKAKRSPEDFVGHIGGDDFVVITTPATMREISAEIVKQFDGRIPDFYDRGDRENGFIFGKTRYGEAMRFPLMTISIAIVTNEQHKLSNPIETSEIAAELKDYAKTIAKSVYVVDKRRTG